jgi:hypothetical protein
VNPTDAKRDPSFRGNISVLDKLKAADPAVIFPRILAHPDDQLKT